MIDEIWPRTAERTADGVLVVGGCDVRDLAATYGTPLFVLDEADVRQRAAEYKDAYGDDDQPFDVFYASKAFLSVAIARWMHDAGLGIDVASGGELAVALRAGVPGERIVMHGNNKSVEEIETALREHVHLLVSDSLDELARIDDVAGRLGVIAPIVLRLTVGVEAHTHEAISTAHEDQKFGLSISSGAAVEAVEFVLAAPNLELHGFHSHIGSQIFDADGFEIAAHRMVGFIASIKQTHHVVTRVLDLGGGRGVP